MAIVHNIYRVSLLLGILMCCGCKPWRHMRGALGRASLLPLSETRLTRMTQPRLTQPRAPALPPPQPPRAARSGDRGTRRRPPPAAEGRQPQIRTERSAPSSSSSSRGRGPRRCRTLPAAPLAVRPRLLEPREGETPMNPRMHRLSFSPGQ